MIARARLVLIQAILVAAAMVATTLPAGAQTTSNLDQSTNMAFRSLFATAHSTSDADADAQARSQNPRHEGIGIGAKIGPLFNKFTSDIAGLNFDTKTGWMGGIFFGGNRPGVVGVQGELMYARKKAVDQRFGEVTQDFLEIPVLVRVNAGSNSLNGILGYFLIGPVFDINLKSKTAGVAALDIKDRYEDFDIGIIVGAGVEITRFLVEGRYNWGLRKVNKGDLGNLTDIKTRSFALLFGVRFN